MAKEKLYYSISEVAEMFHINLSNLRFWEKEIDKLKPHRNDKGTRFYSKDDILLIKQIIFLIEEQDLTLAGVNKRLNSKKDTVKKKQELSERLHKLRSQLTGMIQQIDEMDKADKKREQ